MPNNKIPEHKEVLKRLDDALMRCNRMNMLSTMEDIMCGVHFLKDKLEEIDQLKKRVRELENAL